MKNERFASTRFAQVPTGSLSLFGMLLLAFGFVVLGGCNKQSSPPTQPPPPESTAKPAPADPAPVDSAPVDSEPTEPTTTEPVPAETEPVPPETVSPSPSPPAAAVVAGKQPEVVKQPNLELLPIAETHNAVAPVPVTQVPVATSPSLQTALANLKLPPDWYDSVEVHYDTNKPWKDARLEIRRLLGLGGDSNKQAIKLTCIYRQKDDIGDGHEYPMYLLMGGEHVWGTQAYMAFVGHLLKNPDSGDHIREFLSLASCYVRFGEFDKALLACKAAMNRLPKPPWRTAREADVHDAYGDIYAKMGDVAKAKQHYSKAVRLYPTSKQPYGRHLLKRRATKVQSKVDLLDRKSLATATLRDGKYRVKTLGFSGDKDMYVTVVIRSGRIADIQVEHGEKIEQGATTIIPERIIAKQNLDVDGITGATVTYDGIIDGVFRALKQAGLK